MDFQLSVKQYKALFENHSKAYAACKVARENGLKIDSKIVGQKIAALVVLNVLHLYDKPKRQYKTDAADEAWLSVTFGASNADFAKSAIVPMMTCEDNLPMFSKKERESIEHWACIHIDIAVKKLG